MWGKFKIESNQINVSYQGFGIAKRYEDALKLAMTPEVHDNRSTVIGFAIPDLPDEQEDPDDDE
jgi:hypothetical protein